MRKSILIVLSLLVMSAVAVAGPYGPPVPGPQGPQGIQGVQGAAGPNEVTTSTGTNITGLLAGDGVNVKQAGAGTDYVAPSGNVATASALAANGTDCSAGNYPLGVDAGGNVESCTAAFDPAIPGAIGGTTPGTGVFTSVNSQAGYNLNLLSAPTAISGYSLSAGGSLGTGQYYYAVTYVISTGETNSSSVLSVTTTSGNNTVNLTGIPVSSDSRVTARKIYRTKVGTSTDSTYYLATINNNINTTYTDSLADASLTGAGLQAYRVNSTSNYISIAGTRSLLLDTNLTALGINAGAALTSGNYGSVRTVLIGAGAGQAITTGTANIIMGLAGSNLTTGGSNTVIGDLGLHVASSVHNTTVVGSQAARYLTSGNSSVFLGINSGSKQADGSTNLTGSINSIYIGPYAKGYSNSDNNTIVIGYNAIGLGANTAVIGNDSIVTTALKGNVGIGTTVPAEKLDTRGNIQMGSPTANTGGGLVTKCAEGTVTLSGASGSISSWTSCGGGATTIPMGARIRGIEMRVNTAITSGDGATSWGAAYTNTPTTAITTGQAFTKNTKYPSLHPAYELTTGTVTITVTPNSGTFSGGMVMAVVYYDTLAALSDNP